MEFWNFLGTCFAYKKMFDQLPLGNQKKVISNSRWIFKIPLPTLRSKHASLLVIFAQRAITRPIFGLEQKHMLCYSQAYPMAGWRPCDTIYLANSRLGSLKILLHALKLFGFLVVGFSALALQLLAKPCC